MKLSPDSLFLKIMKLDPDSLSAKFILNGVDKLVFTLLLMSILAMGTQCQRGLEREQMRAAEFDSIKIQKPMELLEDLSDLIRHCTLLTKRGSKHPLSEEDRAQLVSLLLGIELNLEMIRSYSVGRELTSEVIDHLHEIVEAALAKPDITDNDLEELGETLNVGFVMLFDHIVGETTRLVVEGKRLGDGRIVLR